MVQPSYPRDLDRGLESLYYTLRGFPSRAQKPPGQSFRATHSSPKHPPGGSESLPTGSPPGVRSRQQENLNDDRSDRKSPEECLSSPRPRNLPDDPPAPLTPLKIVGPRPRVNPEADAVLIGTSPMKNDDEGRDRNPDYGNTEADRMTRKGKQTGSRDLDVKQARRRSQLKSICPNPVDPSTASQQSRNGIEGEKLRLVVMERRMGKLGLL